MKRIVYLFVAVLLFASCEKNEIGSTATESLSGQWYVNVDAVDENGDVVYTGAEFFEFYYFITPCFCISALRASYDTSIPMRTL